MGDHLPSLIAPKVGTSPSKSVSLAVSPDIFWVQLSSTASAYSSLEESMTCFYEDESKQVVMQEDDFQEIGALVAVKRNERWCRGRLICKGSFDSEVCQASREGD